jgi:uncharacterized MAPEG superfamily protein
MAKLPYVLLFLAVGLIYVPRLLVIRQLVKMPGGLDNNNPRDQQAKLEGFGKRAQGCHLNMIEAFPLFAAGMLASMVGRVDLNIVVGLGSAFILLRVIYIALYLGDKASARSAVWALGLIACTALLLSPLFFATGVR